MMTNARRCCPSSPKTNRPSAQTTKGIPTSFRSVATTVSTRPSPFCSGARPAKDIPKASSTMGTAAPANISMGRWTSFGTSQWVNATTTPSADAMIMGFPNGCSTTRFQGTFAPPATPRMVT